MFSYDFVKGWLIISYFCQLSKKEQPLFLFQKHNLSDKNNLKKQDEFKLHLH